MKFVKALFVSLCLIFTATTAMAGAGHSHGPINQDKVTVKAEKTVNSLINQGVLDNSWAGLPVTTIERTKRNGDLVWLARVENTNAKDAAKRTLYIYLTLTGGFINANYSGQ